MGTLRIDFRLGSVTIDWQSIYSFLGCGLTSGWDQLQFVMENVTGMISCGLTSGWDQLQSACRKLWIDRELGTIGVRKT